MFYTIGSLLLYVCTATMINDLKQQNIIVSERVE